MAESIVSIVLRKLDELQTEERKLLTSLDDEFCKIKRELERMRAFLRDADAREENEEGVKTWVKHVREVAYEIEDVIDDFTLRVARNHKSTGFFGRLCYFIKKLKIRHQIAARIRGLKSQIQDISEGKDRYDLKLTDQGSSSTSSSHASHDPQLLNSLFIEESELVGIENRRNELTEWVVEGSPKLATISVVGMGGLGKTTLVKKVYENPRVKGHFDCRAWITISQSFKIDNLLRGMVKEFFKAGGERIPKGINSIEAIELIEILRNHLTDKRYVAIFDDIWSLEAWESIKLALPDNERGSRIMLTTRNGDLASSWGQVYELLPLAPEDSWDLFCKKAFRNSINRSCPPELEALSRNISKRCNGLPLAIAAIGSLLSQKDKTEWEVVNRSLGSELETSDYLKSMNRVLWLSFKDLPSNLRSCFLYLSIFPEDYDIDRLRITRLWIAEGFIEPKVGKTVEEIAENYLNQLINRSMIQVMRWHDYRRVKRCRVHDLLREIIQSKSREENFSSVIFNHDRSFPERIRRLAIHGSGEGIPQNARSSLRSLLMFGTGKLCEASPCKSLSHIRRLKVLDLENAPIKSFPKEILNLFHLRYLSLRNTNISEVPKSLGRLQNLQVLNLRGTNVSELPYEIIKLEQLRHLIVYRYSSEPHTFNLVSGMRIPADIGSLRSLQKLAFLEADQGTSSIRELGKLTQLRRLAIMKLKKEHGVDLCTSVNKMEHLRSFLAQSINEDEFLDLQTLSSPPPNLQRLYLSGRLERLPHWIASVQNLAKITLLWSGLRRQSVEDLQSLSNLLALHLNSACDDRELCFKAGGFPSLRALKLRKLSELSLVQVEDGAMVNLELLLIDSCMELKNMPLGVDRLVNIKDLVLMDMPEEFMRMIRRDGGEDRCKVQHIPHIRSWRRANRVFEYLS